MDILWQDVRFGLRTMLRNPGLAAVIILILALGIGATSTVFTVINAVVLEGLPYEQPETLVLLASALRRESEVQAMPVSYVDFEDWREAGAELFAELAAFGSASFNFSVDDEAQYLRGELVSAGYFEVLGVEPFAGRFFSQDEDRDPGAHPVAVLSHDLWQQALAGERDLSARRVTLNGRSYQVVGVMPPRHRGLTDQAQIWIPTMMASEVKGPEFLQLRRFRWLQAAGRLRPGVTLEQARLKMDAVTLALAQEYPDSNLNVGAMVVPLAEAWLGDQTADLLVLLGGALFVLLIACTNVANLLLGRALARRQEISLRTALGARRSRLVRQLLTESALLALVGAVAGLLLAHWATGALVAISGVSFKSFARIAVDPLVLAATLGLSLLCGLGFGLAPAWIVSQRSVAEALREGSRGATGGLGRHRFQSSLIVAEIALALTLLIGTGLMIQGFQRFQSVDLGFDDDNLLTLRLFLKDARYEQDEAVRVLVRQLLERIGSVPGVESLALVGPSIPTDSWFIRDFALEEPPETLEENKILLEVHHVSPGYFTTLGVPILAGRDLDFGDAESSAPVVLVSRSLADRYWPDQDAIGKGLRLFRGAPEGLWLRVVGVVDDVRYRGLAPDQLKAPSLYFPILQAPPRLNPILNLLIRPRTTVAAGSLIPSVRGALREVEPGLPPYDLKLMGQRLTEQAAHPRFRVLLMSWFGLVALVLATTGIYGIVSYAVTRLRREIGIRMALGARSREVTRLVLGRAAILAVAGIGLGLVAAFFLTRLLTSFLYGLSAIDPITFGGTALALFAVALAASYVPALRATKVDPMTVLRVE